MTWLEINVIMPKYDNLKNPIDPVEMEKRMRDLARRISYVAKNKAEDGTYYVGFSAIPEFYGCFGKEHLTVDKNGNIKTRVDNITCDENVNLIIAVPLKDTDEVKDKIAIIDKEIKTWAKNMAEDFKQHSIMFTSTIKQVDFVYSSLPSVSPKATYEEKKKVYEIKSELKRKSAFVWHKHDAEDD